MPYDPNFGDLQQYLRLADMYGLPSLDQLSQQNVDRQPVSFNPSYSGGVQSPQVSPIISLLKNAGTGVQLGPAPSYEDWKARESPTAQETPQSIPVTPFGSGQPNTDRIDIASRYRELAEPSHKFSDAYTDAMKDMPQREKVGLLQKILGPIAVFGASMNKNDPNAAARVSSQVLDQGYSQKLRDWQARMEPLERALQSEQQINSQNRIAAGQALQLELQQRTQERLEAKDERQAAEAQRKLDIAQQRANVYEFKANNPDWRLVTQKGGNVFAINPRDPSQTIDTKVNSGTLTDLDKITLGLNADLTKIDAQGEQTRQNIGATGAQNRETAITRGEVQKDVNANRPVRSTAATNSPTQQRIDLQNKVNQARVEHPEWNKYITMINGQLTIAQPKSGIFGISGPTQEQYKSIQDYFRTGKSSSISNSGSSIATPPGKVKVISPDGIEGFIPEGQLEMALKQGYKKAGK